MSLFPAYSELSYGPPFGYEEEPYFGLVWLPQVGCRDSSIAWDLPFSLYLNTNELKHYTFLCKYTKEQLTLSHYNSTQYTVTQLDSSSNNKRNTPQTP